MALSIPKRVGYKRVTDHSTLTVEDYERIIFLREGCAFTFLSIAQQFGQTGPERQASRWGWAMYGAARKFFLAHAPEKVKPLPVQHLPRKPRCSSAGT